MAAENYTSRVTTLYPQETVDSQVAMSIYSQSTLGRVREGHRQHVEMALSELDRRATIAIGAIRKINLVGQETAFSSVDALTKSIDHVVDECTKAVKVLDKLRPLFPEQTINEMKQETVEQYEKRLVSALLQDVEENTIALAKESIYRLREATLIAMETIPPVETWSAPMQYAQVVEETPTVSAKRTLPPSAIPGISMQKTDRRVQLDFDFATPVMIVLALAVAVLFTMFLIYGPPSL